MFPNRHFCIMKKSRLTLLVLLSTISVLGQGTIKFNNRLTGQVDAPISVLGTGEGVGSIPGAMAQLYLIPATGAPVALTPATTFRTTSAAAMFYVNEPTSAVVVPGVPAGGTATIQLRVWIGGSSYETATVFGSSNPIQVSLGGIPAQGAPIPDAVLIGLEGFALPIPEPSAFSLGLLGMGALFLARRSAKAPRGCAN